MKYNPAQQLFVDFFIEALDFMKYSGPTVEIIFGDFHCVIWPSALKSTSFIFPVTAEYHGYRLNVHQEWIDAIVSEKYPTLMRTQAYYYAYGFYEFYNCNNVIERYPQNFEAEAFSYGLTLLNGVPINIPDFIPKELVLSQLKRFSLKQYTFIESVGSDGHHGHCLSLSAGENERLFSQLLEYDKESKRRRLDIRLGTKEEPFENIDEAINYIKFLEKDAVEHDLFLNSPFNRSPYRYDIGAIKSKRRDIIGGIFKIP